MRCLKHETGNVFPALPTILCCILVFFLSAVVSFAEGEVARVLELMDDGRTEEATEVWESTRLEGAAQEVVLARFALEKENVQEALRHLAWVQVKHYREVDWLPAALYVEVLVDYQMGGDGKAVSAMDELKTLYPRSDWYRRAKDQLKRMEKEEANE